MIQTLTFDSTQTLLRWCRDVGGEARLDMAFRWARVKGVLGWGGGVAPAGTLRQFVSLSQVFVCWVAPFLARCDAPPSRSSGRPGQGCLPQARSSMRILIRFGQ